MKATPTTPAIPISRPLLGAEEREAAAAVIDSGWLAQGPRVEAFEEAFAARVGASWAVAVASGTAALELALRVAGVEPGDVVITVSHSFIATANAIRACGAEPVFVDIDAASYDMSPAHLGRVIERDFADFAGRLAYRHLEAIAAAPSPLARVRDPGGRLAAIVVAHQVGMPADLPAIAAVAAAAGVPLVEDAACAAGSQWRDPSGRWRAVGDPGDAAAGLAAFSFHPRKVITTGEGGMVTGNSAELGERLRRLRNHGARALPRGRVYTEAGFNQRMSDLEAAIGLVQLARLDDIVAARRRLVDRYRERLASVPGLSFPGQPEGARTNWQSLILQLDPDRDQSAAIAALAAAGIAAQPGIMCAHLEPPYAAAWGECRELGASERAHRCGLSVPLYPSMTESELDRVCAALAEHLGA